MTKHTAKKLDISRARFKRISNKASVIRTRLRIEFRLSKLQCINLHAVSKIRS